MKLNRDDELLTVKEVGEITKISKTTLYQLIEDGKIPSVRLGRKLVRVPKEKLYEALDGVLSGE